MLGCKNNSISRTAVFALAVVLALGLTSPVNSSPGQPAANLDQIRNGPYDDPWDPAHWVNGNAGKQNAHYVEGYSIAYRAVMTDLPVGEVCILEIGFDVKHSRKHALDCVTYYYRIDDPSHNGAFGHPPEAIDPLAGVDGVSGPPSYVAIDPPIVNKFVDPDGPGGPDPGDDQPIGSFNKLPPDERRMTLWGGTLTDFEWTYGGNLAEAKSEARFRVTFTIDNPTAVLSWGGHIASRTEWGFPGDPQSAGGINGSPYHMRLLDWNLNNLGNQDRSLSAVAVYVPPPECEASGDEVCEGETATLTGSAFGGDPGSYEYCWTKDDPTGPCIGTSANLVIPNAQLSDAGTYYFIVCDQYHCATETCQAVLIVHDAPICEADGDEVCAGQTATLMGSASGGDPGSYTYCWKKDLAGGCIGTSANLVIPNAQLADAGIYYFIVDDQYHCAPDTCPVELIVYDAPICDAVGDEVCEGEEATLSGTAAGGDPGSYTYCWKKDLAGGCISTSANLVIPNAQLADAGTYCFIVDDQYHCAPDTCCVELIVHGSPMCDLDGDEVCAGQTATLTSSVSGGDPGSYTYCWKKDLAGGCISTSANLVIPNAQLSDAGTYYLIVDDQYHCAPDTCQAELVVHDAPVCEADGDEVCAGQTATLTSSVSGGDPGSYTYCWKKDLAGGCIGTSANLVIPNAQLSDAGTYYFIVDDQYHCAPDTCTADLIVHGSPVCDCDGDTVCAGDEATLCCSVTGGDPGSYTYCWKKDLAGGCISTSDCLVIPNAQVSDAGTYYFIVDDQYHCKPDTCQAELVVGDPECELVCPDPPPVCGSTGNTLSVTATGPFPIVDYQWSLTNTGWMITAGQGTPTITYTAGSALSATFMVVVTDELGCKDTCEIVCDCEPGEYCTYTMGGWGSGCPEEQQDDPMSTQPGCIRDHYFSDVFPEGVVIGDPRGPGSGTNWYAALWTSASAVEAFLPAGSTPGALTADLTNPVATPAGVLAGQILALRLNVEYSCAGVFADLDLPGVGCYGGFTIPDTCGMGKFDGMSVNAFLAIADSAVGGLDVLGSYSATYSDLNYTATCLNELFDNCNQYVPEPVLPGGSAAKSSAVEGSASGTLPKEFSLSHSYPNPFNPACNIEYALPTDCQVTLVVYNILGQKVKILVDEYQSAGYKLVKWDGRDNQGRELTSGVYFYRIKAGDFVQAKKMVLMK